MLRTCVINDQSRVVAIVRADVAGVRSSILHPHTALHAQEALRTYSGARVGTKTVSDVSEADLLLL